MSGFVWFYGPGAAVSTTSKTQKTVANSTMEAEFVALNEAARQGLYLRNLLTELGQIVHEPIAIFEDSTSAIFAAKKPVHSSRTKHMDVRYNFIKEKVESDELDVIYIDSLHQTADVLTKPLAKTLFSHHMSRIMSGINANSQTGNNV